MTLVDPRSQDSRELLVVPLDEWPMPQKLGPPLNPQKPHVDMLVPRFRLAEGRLRVLLDAHDANFLRTLTDSDRSVAYALCPKDATSATIATFPHVQIPTVDVPKMSTKERYIAIDLTPDGIEFEGSIVDPRTSGRLKVIVRVVHKPEPADPSRGRWSLELVRDSKEGDLRRYLFELNKAFSEARGRALDVELDAGGVVPAIRWPLDVVKKSGLALRTDVNGKRVDWQFEVDAEATRARVLGTPVEGGELPTVVMIAPDRALVSKDGDDTTVTIDADRRPRAPGGQAPTPVAGPRLLVEWKSDNKPVTVAIAGDDKDKTVRWRLNPDGLATELVARYRAAGVHPPGAKTTYAFMPIDRGWLQWPLPIPGPDPQHDDAKSDDESRPVAFDGSLEFAIAEATDKLNGRRVAVFGADRVSASAVLTAGSLVKEKISLEGASGEVSGMLWFATGSPSPQEILPHLRNGPVALASPWLGFGRAPPTAAESKLLLSSTGLAFGGAYALEIAMEDEKAHATAWIRSDELPVVTAVAMSRTAESSPEPLSTRDLVPRVLQRDPKEPPLITRLSFAESSGVPVLTYRPAGKDVPPDTLPLSEPDIWPSVPLVPVTLAGIEFEPASETLPNLKSRLRHDLPVLDELFAKTRLPEKAPVSTKGQIAIELPPPDTPTSLDPDALSNAWRRARDQLHLCYTQASTAIEWGAWNRSDAKVEHLFEPATWTSQFLVEPAVTIGSESYAFGQFSLDKPYSGSAALCGVTADFKLNGVTLTRESDANPVRVVGFAAALWNGGTSAAPAWRDTRGSTSESIPQTKEARGVAQFIVRAAATTTWDKDDKVVTTQRWRATSTQLIEIEPPYAARERRLALWFRDLPLETASDNTIEFVAADNSSERALGPEQSAFDAGRLPFGAYEWRFCNDPPKNAEPPAHADHDLAAGPFRFRPLRLLGVKLTRGMNGYVPEAASVVGLLSPPGTSARSADAGPFGPDRAYATGNLVAVRLLPEKAAAPLTFKQANWSRFTLQDSMAKGGGVVPADTSSKTLAFRLADLQVRLGGSPKSAPTTARLELDLATKADDKGRPMFDTAALDVVLFGSTVRFTGGVVGYAKKSDELVVDFAAGTDSDRGTCVRIEGARLRWMANEAGRSVATLTLRGRLTIAMADSATIASATAADYRSLIELRFSEKPAQDDTTTLSFELSWCNIRTGNGIDVAAEVDHSRGLIAIGATSDAAGRSEPVAGLPLMQAKVDAHLTLAIRPETGTQGPASVLRGVSGFGSLLVTTAEAGVSRFRHVVQSAVEPKSGDPAMWSSDIEVDFVLTRSSRIQWPIGSLPRGLKDAAKNPVDELETLTRRVNGKALTGSIGPYDATSSLSHEITLAVTGARIATAALQTRVDESGGVALAAPWYAHALAQHTLILGGDKAQALSWTTVEHVGFFDARSLAESAREDCDWPKNINVDQLVRDRDFAFAARSAVIADNDPTYVPRYGPPEPGTGGGALRNGLVLRAVAHAGFPIFPMALHLSSDTVSWDNANKRWVAKPEAFSRKIGDKMALWDGIVMIGASPSVVRVDGVDPVEREPSGVVLSLPWIATVEDGFDFGVGGARKLAAFRQATTKATSWDAPDFDWAAGSPAPVSRKASQPVGLRTGNASRIAAALNAAVNGATWAPDEEVRALMHVEQAFPRESGSVAAVEVPDRPLWLRTLMALCTVWEKAKSTPELMQARMTSIVPAGHGNGRFARVAFAIGSDALAPARADAKSSTEDSPSEPAAPALFAAIGSHATMVTELPELEAKAITGADTASLRSRLVGRADSLVTGAVAAVVVLEPSGPGKLGWIGIDITADEDSKLSIPQIDPLDQRLFASTALGWPTRHGTEIAATGAIGMGPDRPFQDAGPVSDPGAQADDSVRRYGSGLSGRSASLSFGARAQAGVTAKAADGTVTYPAATSPIFFSLGRKTIFNRPKDFPLVSPPARHLSPSSVRIVTPVARDLETALSRVVRGRAATILPPYLQRTTFGLRPGAMQAEFDALVFTEGATAASAEDLDGEFARFGRPGHAGPVLTRQIRPPRGTGLPRVPLYRPGDADETFVESHGRRTYVCIDYKEKDGRFAKPFALFDGAATVVRRGEAATTRSFHFRVQERPLRPYWEGELTLAVASPLVKSDKLPDELAWLGLLRVSGTAGVVSASLSIDGGAWPFTQALYDVVGDVVEIKFSFGQNRSLLGSVNAALERTTGDSVVSLTMRCANDDPGATPPPRVEPFPLAGNPLPQSGGDPLEPETRRVIQLPLTVQPRGRATMDIGMSTLVFADPAYDRELSGPGVADVQRDSAGSAWKLALDRNEYGSDTPVYLAFGKIDAARGTFVAGLVSAALLLERNPAPGADGKTRPPERLMIAGTKQIENGGRPTGRYDIHGANAYGITFDRLRRNGEPAGFDDGDQLVVTAEVTLPDGGTITLSTRASYVPRPVIAPPPAVYSLVVLGEKTARVALHATAPLPQKIEFPHLVDDLALGNIRRRALFEWRAAKLPGLDNARATLVKIDRAGGGQVPDFATDIQDEQRL